jgi:hypothetical protein
MQSMKRVAILGAALLGLAATMAVADTMNLGYACRTAANTGAAATNEFDTNATGPCNDGVSYTATKHFVCSFKNTTLMPGWAGCHVVIDIQIAENFPFPDFWAVGAGGCNDGALSAPNVVADATNCTNMYTVAPADGQTDSNNIFMDVATGRVRMDSYHTRNVSQVDLPVPASSGGYLANNIRMAPGTPDVCAGCDVPACILLTTVEYFSVQDIRTINTPEYRSFVTWNGGATNCIHGDPIKNSTWGKVKALYR